MFGPSSGSSGWEEDNDGPYLSAPTKVVTVLSLENTFCFLVLRDRMRGFLNLLQGEPVILVLAEDSGFPGCQAEWQGY
jgi:hypothetical protein